MPFVRPILFIATVLLTALAASGQQVKGRHVHTYLGSVFLHDSTRPGPAAAGSMPAAAGKPSRPLADKLAPNAAAAANLMPAVAGGRGVTLSPLQVAVATTPSTCNAENGTVAVKATGGTPPYLYSYDGYAYQTIAYTEVFGPAALQVTVMDATGATATITANVGNNFPQVESSVKILQYPTGCSGTDGSVQLTPIGGVPPYSYSIDYINWQTSNVFTGLPPGDYNFFTKDANGCIGETWNPIPGTGCFSVGAGSGSSGICTGTSYIQITALGRPQPMSYSLDGTNYQSSELFPNLPVGTYNVYMRDGVGQQYIYREYIYPMCFMIPSVTVTDATCGNADGSIVAGAVNGTPPYSYSLDGFTYQSGNTFTGQAPGYYTVFFKDATGWVRALNPTVNSGCPLYVTVAGTNTTCGYHNGTIVATGTGGEAPYTYSRDAINFQSSPVFSNLAAGPYSIMIRDAAGNTANNGLIITDVPGTNCLTLSATATDATCGNANGTITGIVSNGTAPFQYSLDGGGYTGGASFTVTAGNHTITVKDANGYTTSASAVVGNLAGPQPSAVATPATCLNNDGGFVISATGGTPPFQYAVDNQAFQPGAAFSGLTFGTHTIMVKDANGCSTSSTASVPQINTLSVNAGRDPTICQGAAGVVLAGVSNGTQFSWSPATGLNNTGLLQPTADPSVTTTYTLTAMLGACQGRTSSVTVIVMPAPIADAGEDTAICYGQSVQLKGSGGSVYQWSPAAGLDNASIQDPTVETPHRDVVYQLMVTDASGCTSLSPAKVSVTVIPPPAVYVGNDTSVLGGQPVPLNVVDINNSGFSSYAWTPADGLSDPAIRDPVASVYESTTYTVVATTAGGCSASASIELKVYSVAGIFVPNAFSPNGDGHNDILKAIPVGIAKFQYFAVYARWGQRVFFTSDPGQGWDGTVGGQAAVAGAYVWMAGGIDYKGQVVERKGTVIVIR